VALWSNQLDKARKLAKAEKGRYCNTPKEVAENADCIFLCLGDTQMARAVILGPDGISSGARPGCVVADASTISPSESRKIGQVLKQKGVDMLDAPCTGSTPGAEGGNLTFMVGGDAVVFEGVRPYFEPMGKRLFYCGSAGMGLQAKLTQNLILCNIMMAYNEGMVLAAKGGVDPQLMYEVLDASAAKSGLISYKTPFVFRRDFQANFATKWMHKDIGLMLDSGKELGVPLPLTALSQQMFQMAISSGLGDEDFCSTIKVLEKVAGIEVKPGTAQ
jgi:3-hydroxyisobutyrate dehydrogenase/2-hydroxy-3-oxopropionate reductase